MCAFTQRAREAGMAQSDFGRALAGAERRMERAAVELARTRRLLNGRIWRARSGLPLPSPRRWRNWLCSRGCFRPIPGIRKAAELTEQMLLDTVPIEMGYARSGMVSAEDPRAPSEEGNARLSTSSNISILRYAATSTASRRRATAAGVLAYRHVSARQAGAGLPRP